MGAAASPPPSPPPQTIVPQSQQVDEVNSTEVVVAVAEEVSVAVPPASSSDSGAGPSTTTECVICLAELDESGEDPTTTLICGHRFHAACVSEWLSKDGRCPTCRRQIQEVAARAQPAAMDGILADNILNARASMQSMAILMLESRRLMMLATMEAALAVCICSPLSNPFRPPLCSPRLAPPAAEGGTAPFVAPLRSRLREVVRSLAACGHTLAPIPSDGAASILPPAWRSLAPPLCPPGRCW